MRTVRVCEGKRGGYRRGLVGSQGVEGDHVGTAQCRRNRPWREPVRCDEEGRRMQPGPVPRDCPDGQTSCVQLTVALPQAVHHQQVEGLDGEAEGPADGLGAAGKPLATKPLQLLDAVTFCAHVLNLPHADEAHEEGLILLGHPIAVRLRKENRQDNWYS